MLTIDIIKSGYRWRGSKCATKTYIKSIISKVLEKFPNINSLKNIEVAILLTHNDQIQQLNNEFLSKNKPTNVLSFPDEERNYKTILELKPDSNYIKLGDIAFSYETIDCEASEQNKSFEHHFTHLLIHGLLHLLGFDHKTDEEAGVMQTIEIDVLSNMQIRSPY